MEASVQRHAPADLPRERDPLYRRLGGPQDRFGPLRKMNKPLVKLSIRYVFCSTANKFSFKLV